jgi:predicted nucleic acid-binding protein
MAVLDTSLLIDLERGRDAPQAAFHHLVERRAPMRVPAQVAIEYIAGYEDPVANLHDLETSFEVGHPDRDALLETARVARQVFEEGVFPGWADARIAASAILAGEEVVSRHPEDFEALGCSVWDYTDEVRSAEGES